MRHVRLTYLERSQEIIFVEYFIPMLFLFVSLLLEKKKKKDFMKCSLLGNQVSEDKREEVFLNEPENHYLQLLAMKLIINFCFLLSIL